MASPLDERAGATSADAQYRSVLSHFQTDLAEKIDVQQMFVLIDGALPFEACLYYQVLPLYLEDSRLVLGMVNPDDRPAEDYVRRIIAYHNYRPQPQPISSTALQTALSAYLHYTGNRPKPGSAPAPSQDAAAASPATEKPDREPAPKRSQRPPARTRKEPRVDRNTQPTLVVDSPEDLRQELAPPRFRPIYQPPTETPLQSREEARSAESPAGQIPDPTAPPDSAPLAEDLQSADPLFSNPSGAAFTDAFPSGDRFPSSTATSADGQIEELILDELAADAFINELLSESTAQSSQEPPPSLSPVQEADINLELSKPDPETLQPAPSTSSQLAAAPATPLMPELPLETLQDYLATFIPVEQPPQIPTQLIKPIPVLKVQTNHLSRPAESLSVLAPRDLLQELLGRVMVGGIGRLYFEHQPHCGRILWSQNGVLQSVIDRLDLRQFRGVIAELKQLAGLPMVPVSQPKQVEIERLHDRTRLLLRFRFIPTEQGEEATLQILRGAALKFYQQQQIATLERDALRIARQLQTKLNEIRDRARQESGMVAAKLEVLPALSQIIKTIEEQVDSLQPEDLDSPESPPQDPPGDLA